jgi:hypothetical protein
MTNLTANCGHLSWRTVDTVPYRVGNDGRTLGARILIAHDMRDRSFMAQVTEKPVLAVGGIRGIRRVTPSSRMSSGHGDEFERLRRSRRRQRED